MELKDLEKRKEEIIGFNKDIENKLNQIVQANKKLQEDFNALMEQARVNAGALGEVNGFIEAIKKNGTDTKTENTKVDKKSKK